MANCTVACRFEAPTIQPTPNTSRAAYAVTALGMTASGTNARLHDAPASMIRLSREKDLCNWGIIKPPSTAPAPMAPIIRPKDADESPRTLCTYNGSSAQIALAQPKNAAERTRVLRTTGSASA